MHAHPLGKTTERPAPEIHLYRHRLRVTDPDYFGHVGNVRRLTFRDHPVEVETVVGRIGTCDVVVNSRLRDERPVYARCRTIWVACTLPEGGIRRLDDEERTRLTRFSGTLDEIPSAR